MEPGTVIRSVGNPVPDCNMAVDPNFEIADLPVKLELRYVIESKRAAHGLDCPTIDYRSKDCKNQQVFHILFQFYTTSLIAAILRQLSTVAFANNIYRNESDQKEYISIFCSKFYANH